MQGASITARSPARVLFVPDALFTGELRESFLDRDAVQTRSVESAADAVSTTELWRPSVVVFRSEQQGHAPSAFCAQLRAAGRDTPLKLVMITDQLGSIDDALDAGSDCHLIAPVATEQLLDIIASLLQVSQRRSPRAPLETLVQLKGFQDGDGSATLSNCVNVSEDGMLLECSDQLSMRAKGELQFYLPGAGARLSLRGVVRLTVDEVRLHYAIEFTDLQPAERSMLRRYVEGSGAT